MAKNIYIGGTMAREKITTEKSSKKTVVAEDLATLQLKDYTSEHFVAAVNDLALHVNNAYFRTPFSKCPDCNKGNNSVMAHFGDGGANKIGNLKGFQATIGDIVSWKSDSHIGLSVVNSKENGVFGFETSHFGVMRKEPAVIERLIIPSKYRPILGKMATYLANKDKIEVKKLVKIGEREYPNAIAKEL